MIKYCGNCGQGYETGVGTGANADAALHVCALPRTILIGMDIATLNCPHCGKEIKINLEAK